MIVGLSRSLIVSRHRIKIILPLVIVSLLIAVSTASLFRRLGPHNVQSLAIGG